MQTTSTTQSLCIRHAELVLPDNKTQLASLVIENGTIAALEPSAFLPSPAMLDIDGSDCWLTPGLIDIHFNGALGVGFNHASDQEIAGLFQNLPQYGVTAVMPTLITAPKVDMIHQMMVIEGILPSLSTNAARCLGLHLEGPFINADFRGAHPKEHVLPITDAHLDDLLSPNTRRITLAPEIGENMRFIEKLTAKGIACAIGHTGADFATTQAAMKAGATFTTHLFNAMKGFHHRNPGPGFACLMDENQTVELIADGHHLAPETIDLILRLKDHSKLVVTTDSNPLAGLKPGTTVEFGGQAIRIEKEQTINAEGKLAGSHLFLDAHVRNLVKWGLLPFEKAVQLATTNPARYLGVDSYIGVIRQNTVADLILWDKETLAIKQVFVAGQPVLGR